jgi:hypothetical protein
MTLRTHASVPSSKNSATANERFRVVEQTNVRPRIRPARTATSDKSRASNRKASMTGPLGGSVAALINRLLGTECTV